MSTLSRYFDSRHPVVPVTYLATVGSLSVAAAMLYLRTAPSLAICTISAGLIFGIYLINKFTDSREDVANNARRAQFIERSRVWFYCAALSIAGSALALAAMQKLEPYHVFLICLGLAYSFRVFPYYVRGKGFRFIRLKEIPFLKNLLVGLLWGVSVFAVPMLFMGFSARPTLPMVVVIAANTLSILTNTLFGDIKDVVGDTVAGNRTLPSLWGVRRTFALMIVMNALWLSGTLAMLLTGHIDTGHFLFALALVLYPLAYIVPHYARLGWFGVEILGDTNLLVNAVGLVLLAALQ